MKQRRRIYYSAAQRAEIWDRWRRGESMHEIGPLFDRGHSSIFSVLAASGGIRPAPRRRKLALEWSPQQIAGWLKWTHPGNEARQVSHETIYRSLYVQARGVLKKQLIAHLRSQRAIRRSRYATLKGKGLGQIPDVVSISQRPASVEDRAVPGHWEGDLLCGSNNSFIVTLVERHSRYVMLAKIPNKETETVVNALIKQARKLPGELYKSLTWDRGKELADHRRFTMETDIAVFFCDPQSPWQRGSNENTNRLLRQYFPKGLDLAAYSQAELNKVPANWAALLLDARLILNQIPVELPSPGHLRFAPSRLLDVGR